MPGDVFVDTSGFFALMVARDPHHARCAELVGDLSRRRGLAFTSEAIISETLAPCYKLAGRGISSASF